MLHRHVMLPLHSADRARAPFHRFVRHHLLTAVLVALSLCAGCQSIQAARSSCALLVVVDGGRSLASPAQLESLERRVKPLLVERGLILSHDQRNAAWLARVEFSPDPNDPRDGDFVIRVIEPNSLLQTPVPPADPLESVRRPQEQSLQRMEQQIFQEGKKTSC